MRARKLIYENLPDMSAAIKELSFQPHRFQDCLVAVVGSACGTDGAKGLLESKTTQYSTASPLEWAKELDSLYDLLGPSSILMNKVADSANHQMPIDPTLLPRCIIDEFPKAGSYQSRLVSGLRRQATGSCSIRLWEWFWANFLRAMLSIQLDEPSQTVQEQMVQDDFFSSITRNPFLGLVHRYLTQLSQNPLKVRFVNMVHLFLIEELQFKFKRREGGTQEEVKYRLKPHYLHLLYLLILGQELQEETVKNYFMFLQKIAENYSSTTVLSHNQNIRNLLRVWLTLVTRSVTVEQHLFQKLKLANQKQGWFRLARCPIDRFQHSLQHLKLSPRELTRACSAKSGILRLLEKCGEWQPTYSLLAVIEQYLAYQQRRGEMEFQRDRQDQGGAIVRAIERILLATMEQTNNRETVQALHSRLNQRVGQLYGRGIALNIDEKSLSRAKSISKAKAERSGLISKQVLREGNVWAYPLQHNEFLLLYRLMHWIAVQIDRILPGQNLQEHPRVNIRIFCNPIVFLVTVAILVAIIRTVLVG